MNFVTVRDILHRVQEFHRRLGEAYEKSRDEARNERSRLLLDFMVKEEEKLQRALEDCGKEAPEGVLDTWIQFVPQRPLEEISKDLHLRPDMTMDEIMDRAMKVDQALIDVFRRLGTANTSRVREFFNGLAEMEAARNSEVAKGHLGNKEAYGGQ
jgi:hypothetical protein